MKNLTLVIFYMVLMTSCADSEYFGKQSLSAKSDMEIHQLAKQFFSPLPDLDLNGLSDQHKKWVELGKALFFETKLSRDQTISCASCHIMEQFGVDNLRVSPGDKNQVGTRNTPTVFNAFLQYGQLWTAKFRTVEDHVEGPIFGEWEMRVIDTLEMLNRFIEDEYYFRAFTEAFPYADTAITLESIKTAIGAFQRTLITPSRFDDYLKGDLSALNAEEKLGLKKFYEYACVSCHTSSLLGGQMATRFPMYGYYWEYTNSTYFDKGRMEVTNDPGDKFVFKVPQLRNVEKTHPYMHDGVVETLEEAIRINALASSNIVIPDRDIDLIAAFLRSLTGEIPKHAIEGNMIFK